MKGEEFLNSEWIKKAKDPTSEQHIKEKFTGWTKRISNNGIVKKAEKLFTYFTSGDISTSQKLIVMAALLYVMAPLDLIPDWFGVIGWLDDIGVATFALNYVLAASNEAEILKLKKASITGTTDIPKLEYNLSVPIEGYQLSGLSNRSEKLTEKLKKLRAVTNCLGLNENDFIVDTIEDEINASRGLNVMVVGRYSTGKSTLVNALLGKKLLPSSDVPTTKAITYLTRGEPVSVYAEMPDGETVVEFSDSDLSDIHNETIGKAVKISVLVPDFPYSNVTIIDTPGLEDTDKNVSQLTLDSVPMADALIVVLDAGYLQSKVEFDFISSLMKDDRERKLIIVINKIDKNPKEAPKLITECKRILTERGIDCSNIYCLSARNALNQTDPDFTNFQLYLKEFLEKGLKSEVLRRAEVKVDNYINTLLEACQGAISSVVTSEKEAREAREKIEKVKDAVSRTYRKQLVEINRCFGEYRNQFFVDFGSFIDSLKTSAASEINASSLEKLRNSNALAEKLKQSISKYVSEKLTEFQNNIQANIKNSELKVKAEIADLSLPLNVNVSDFSSLSSMFMPVTVAASWLFCGFFNFISIAVLAVVGREFLESAISDFLTKFSVNQVRGKLIAEVGVQLDSAKVQMQDNLNNCFDSMLSEIEKTFSAALAESLLPYTMADKVHGDSNKIKDIGEIRKELEQMLK